MGRKRLDQSILKEIQLYIERAEDALEVARLNLANDFYSAAINRAYYAVFYAANALLASEKLARSKHSGVLAAFRQYFIKTGLLPTALSEIYGRLLEDRHQGDYELLVGLSREEAEADIAQAVYFVEEVKLWLRKEGWI